MLKKIVLYRVPNLSFGLVFLVIRGVPIFFVEIFSIFGLLLIPELCLVL
jgi:hypothetical protein